MECEMTVDWEGGGVLPEVEIRRVRSKDKNYLLKFFVETFLRGESCIRVRLR